MRRRHEVRRAPRSARSQPCLFDAHMTIPADWRSVARPLPHDRNPPDDDAGLQAMCSRLTRRLDALCVLHDRRANHLDELSFPAFERACSARRRFDHLRDLMRLRLFVVRTCRPKITSATRARLLAAWPPLLSASRRLERLTADLGRDPRC